MAKMKYHNGSAWEELDAKNGDTVDGLHFRINASKLQYSTNGTTWTDAGTNTADATALAADILAGKTAYVNGVKVTGTMVDRAGDTAAASIARSGTTIRLRATQGYRDGTNDFVTHADANDVAANIKAGVTIRSLTGTFTADANAVASDIKSGKSGYVNGVKITGNYVPPAFAAGDILVGYLQQYSTQITTSTYTKNGAAFTTNVAGVVRFKFKMINGDGQTVYGRIYKNGVAVGTVRSVSNNVLTEFTQDITVAEGDVLDLRTYQSKAPTSYYGTISASAIYALTGSIPYTIA